MLELVRRIQTYTDLTNVARMLLKECNRVDLQHDLSIAQILFREEDLFTEEELNAMDSDLEQALGVVISEQDEAKRISRLLQLLYKVSPALERFIKHYLDSACL